MTPLCDRPADERLADAGIATHIDPDEARLGNCRGRN